MKQLLTSLLLLSSLIGKSQNVGIGVPSPLFKLDVLSPLDLVARFAGAAGMYIALTENNIYRGYIGSYAGNAEDVDFGTGTGNTTGRVHLTIQGTPRLTVTSTGSVDVTNELTRSSKTGVANLLPVCYGNISASGGINSGGSSNFTVLHTVTGIYEITITGEAYQFQQYATTVTAIGNTPIIVTTSSGAGKLQVYTHNIAGTATDANFHFVVYKP